MKKGNFEPHHDKLSSLITEHCDIREDTITKKTPVPWFVFRRYREWLKEQGYLRNEPFEWRSSFTVEAVHFLTHDKCKPHKDAATV